MSEKRSENNFFLFFLFFHLIHFGPPINDHQRTFPKSEKNAFPVDLGEREEKTRNDGTEADRAFNLRNLVAGLENHFNAAQLIVSNLINGLREHSENENNEKTERKSKLNNRKFENYLSLFYWRDRKV